MTPESTQGAKQRVLITGGSGLLGTALLYAWSSRYALVACYRSHPLWRPGVDLLQLDVGNREQVFGVMEQVRPQAVVHTAALLVEASEADPDLAYQVNVTGTRHVAEACCALGVRLLHISTDAIFDGEKGNYSERDTPSPVNHYGRTKLLAEQVAQESHENVVVVRTAFYGWSVRPLATFPVWIINMLGAGQIVRGLVDQRTSVMFAGDLAEVLALFIDNDQTGLFHVASRDSCTKFDFACIVARIFDLDSTLIRPTTLEQMTGWKAKRPRDLSLDVEHVETTLGVKMPLIEDGLLHMRSVDPIAFSSVLVSSGSGHPSTDAKA